MHFDKEKAADEPRLSLKASGSRVLEPMISELFEPDCQEIERLTFGERQGQSGETNPGFGREI
jgi:ABC-type cobalt transport system substrate-binding protein